MVQVFGRWDEAKKKRKRLFFKAKRGRNHEEFHMKVVINMMSVISGVPFWKT